jgi:hypothetical protein
MGANIFQAEHYQPANLSLDFFGGITPVKTEPLVLRAVSELISAQVLTQQIITQLATLQLGKGRGGQAFIGMGQRVDETGAFEQSAEPVRLLTQRIDELEKRLDEAVPKKSTAAGR